MVACTASLIMAFAKQVGGYIKTFWQYKLFKDNDETDNKGLTLQ